MRYLKKTLCAALAAMMILMGTSCDVLMAPANPEEVTEKTPTGNHPSESTPGEADSVGGNPAETAPSESEKGEETEEVTIKEEITEKVVSKILNGIEIYIPLGELVDFEKELARLKGELEKAENEIKRAEGKLSNQGFVAKAPKALIDGEKAKLQRFTELRDKILASIEELKD